MALKRASSRAQESEQIKAFKVCCWIQMLHHVIASALNELKAKTKLRSPQHVYRETRTSRLSLDQAGYEQDAADQIHMYTGQ